MSLTRQVSRLTRVVLAALAFVIALNGLALGVLYLKLSPETSHFTVGARNVRIANAANLNMETGLRGYLLTGNDTFLEPYRQGEAAYAKAISTARTQFEGQNSQLALVNAMDAKRASWVSGWVKAAVAGGPSYAATAATTQKTAFIQLGKTLFDDYRTAEASAETHGDALRTKARRTEDNLLGTTLVLQVVLLVLVAVIVRRESERLRALIVAPVERLLDAIARVRDGNLSPGMPAEGPEELRRISDGLASMTLSLREERERAREREADLLTARREAEAAVAAKTAFLATMSHEIRTPMNAVIGMTGLLIDSNLSEEQRDFAETVRNSGDALLVIINDILDFSKIESGGLELERQPFSLRDCVESSLDLVAAQAAAKGLDINAQLDMDVPHVVEGDVTRLRQVLVNLLSNAVKFTPTGEVLVTVSLAEPEHEGTPPRLAFAVSDTGIGIPTDRMDRLFQSFSQVDASTTRSYGGSGLGLAISRRLAEAMDGTLMVTSTQGEGSTFTLTVPLPRGRESEDRLRVVPAELPGRRVLIVDDNSTNRRILRLQLESWGMEIDDEGDPRVALLRAANTSYDLVITDMHMPHLDGLELSTRLRQLDGWGSVPLVLLTSLGQRPESAIDLQLVHLTKPVKAMALRDTVARTLGAMHDQVSRESQVAPLPRLRVLLAEDNVVNQKVATLLLQRMGQDPRVVSNGEEALEVMRHEPIDVILMDVQMPVMDGLEATRRIRAQIPRDRQPRIVAMTANALVEDREECLAAGMDDYLAKPVRAEELAATLIRVGGGTPMTAPTPAAEPPGSAVDPSVLESLTGRLGDRGATFRASLIATWREETAARLDDLDVAATTGNTEDAARVAHTLKSSSAALGALPLSRLCEQIELGLRTGEERDLSADAGAMRAAVSAASTAFTELWDA